MLTDMGPEINPLRGEREGAGAALLTCDIPGL